MVVHEDSAQNRSMRSGGDRRRLRESEGMTIHWDGTNRMGAVVRERRLALGLSLSQVADRVGCAKGYLSEIETGVRERPPGKGILCKLEQALGLEPNQLQTIADWELAPPAVREQVAHSRHAMRRLRDLIASAQGRPEALDKAFTSGELRRLVESLDPSAPKGVEVVALPREVPVVNKVTAGYPREFTDLGYPARVSDEYVRVPDIDDADAFGARVVGDSMEPEYREGDVVVFSPRAPVSSGMDCFVRLEPDQETTFKRVYFERGVGGEELIRLQPLNSAYPPVVVPRERVAGLYSGVSVVRTLRGGR